MSGLPIEHVSYTDRAEPVLAQPSWRAAAERRAPKRIALIPALPADMAETCNPAIALARTTDDIDARFDRLLAVPDDARASLYRAMRFATMGGAPRVHALLVVATADLVAVDRERSGRVGLALECINAYVVVHHELLSIGAGDLLQRRDTVHALHGQATAILAGDCLHAMAFEILCDPATHPDPRVRADLALHFARVSGPPDQVDRPETGPYVGRGRQGLAVAPSLQSVAVVSAAVEAGAILGGMSPAERGDLRCYAADIARAARLAVEATDAARAEEAALIDQAIGTLRPFGGKADLLRAIARHMIVQG